MNLTASVLLMTPTEGQNPWTAFIPLILVIIVFYFFMIRPQVKRQKEIKQFRDELKKGDKVMTIGGIYGKIVETGENTVLLEVEGKMRLKVDKTGIVKDSSGIIMPK